MTAARSPARHRRLFARNLTIASPEHQRAFAELRVKPPTEPEVEIRPLARYDALIPA